MVDGELDAQLEETLGTFQLRITALEMRLEVLEELFLKGNVGLARLEDQTDISPADDSPYRIVAVDGKPIETTESWVKYAWKITFENVTNKNLLVSAKIQFLDQDNFELEFGIKNDIKLLAGQTQSVSGSTYIDLANADKVASISAESFLIN